MSVTPQGMIIPLIVTVLEPMEEVVVVVVELVVGSLVVAVAILPIFLSPFVVLPSSFKNRLQNFPTLTVTILVSCDDSLLLEVSSSLCSCCAYCGLTNGNEGGDGMGSMLLPDFRGRSDPSAMKAMAFK